MKRMVWLLRLGIVLLGATLVFETLYTSKRHAAPKVNVTKQAAGDKVRTAELKDFEPGKVEAARVWLTVKGPSALTSARALHVRTMAAGQRVKPDSPQSAVYPHNMIQVYSDDPEDYYNSVTYTKNENGTVTLTHYIPAKWEKDPIGSHYEDVVAMDTANMLKPSNTVPVGERRSPDVLKLVQRIV